LVVAEILIGLSIVVAVLASIVAFRYRRWSVERLRALSSGSRIAETSVGPIEYVLKGRRGPVVLFLHGMPGGYNQAPAEQRDGYRLLAPSRPGYLATPLAAGRTPAQQAKAYAALLDTLGIERVVVMGASGGGPSAIEFSALFPERTTALILLEAVSQSFPNEGKIMPVLRSDLVYWLSVSTILKTAGIKALVAMQIPDKSNAERVTGDPRKLAEFERAVWSIWPMSKRLVGYRNDLAQVDDLALPADRVRAPALIVHGTGDRLVPFAHSEKLARQIDGARLHAVAGADHMMPISHREELELVIGEFFSSLRV
jgi:pimeloyl-ACP methyl ester carboxylesterase